MKTKLLAFLITLSAVCVCGGQSRIPGPGGLFNYPTYTDTFVRSNGVLTSPWVEPSATITGGDLQIISNQVFAHGTQPGNHFFDIYNGGTFGPNQYSTVTIETVGSGGTAQSQGVIVRGKTANQYYNDLVPTPTVSGNQYQLGNEQGIDFCTVALYEGATAYTVGDVHELDVVGSAPVFFWSKHNGNMEASCIDTTNNYTTGVPGVGIVVDNNSTPTVAAGTWTGGTLPALSTTHTDNFTRSNAGWLGKDWWFGTNDNGVTFTCPFYLVSNQAKLTGSTCTNFGGLAIWTTPFGSTQSPIVTLGTIAGSGFEGVVARATPAQIVNNVSFYTAFYGAGDIKLYAFSGGTYNLLVDLGSAASVSTIELDVSGTSPVVLTAKVNGSTFGSSFSDSTYKLTGAFEGIVAYANGTTISGWTGN